MKEFLKALLKVKGFERRLTELEETVTAKVARDFIEVLEGMKNERR